jgi:hypothetical protein
LTVDVAGYDSSVGFTTWANNPATANADVSNKAVGIGTTRLFIEISM